MNSTSKIGFVLLFLILIVAYLWRDVLPDHSDSSDTPPRRTRSSNRASHKPPSETEEPPAVIASPTPFDEWILLARQAPDAALERLNLLNDKEDLRPALAAVCLAIAETDPSRAMKAAWDLDLGKFSDDRSENVALESIAELWGLADLEGALEWAATLPHDEEVRGDRIIKGMACAAANQDPATAARMVSVMMSSDNGMQLDAAMTILHRFASRDSNMAREWVNYFPNGPIRERGIRALTKLASQ